MWLYCGGSIRSGGPGKPGRRGWVTGGESSSPLREDGSGHWDSPAGKRMGAPVTVDTSLTPNGLSGRNSQCTKLHRGVCLLPVAGGRHSRLKPVTSSAWSCAREQLSARRCALYMTTTRRRHCLGPAERLA